MIVGVGKGPSFWLDQFRLIDYYNLFVYLNSLMIKVV